MNRVRDKVAIVTGAAQGLGRAQAFMLAREGAKVIVADILETPGEEAVAEIRRNGGESIFIKHDVTSEDSWEEVINKTLAKFGKLDVLVNNAGVGFIRKIEDTSLEEWRWLMSVNLEGVFLGTKHAIRAMKKGGGGSIINISSICGMVGSIDMSAYTASKGGIRLFTKAAALECSKAGYDYNIRVNSVLPGVVETPLTTPLLEDEASMKATVELHPIGHLVGTDDIAYGVLYLASDESKSVTGADLVIDGGWTAR